MKYLSLLVLVTLVFTGIASASITPIIVPGSPTPVSGGFEYNYTISVPDDERLAPGNYAMCNPGGVPCGTFFTIYDFAGYVGGTIMAPTNWTTSVQLVGLTPTDQNPTDNPGILNLTWKYTGPIKNGPINDLPGFAAESIFGLTHEGQFTYQAEKTNGMADQGIGPIEIPSGVPEPGSMALIGGGLVGLAMLRRKLVHE